MHTNFHVTRIALIAPDASGIDSIIRCCARCEMYRDGSINIIGISEWRALTWCEISISACFQTIDQMVSHVLRQLISLRCAHLFGRRNFSAISSSLGVFSEQNMRIFLDAFFSLHQIEYSMPRKFYQPNRTPSILI